MEEPINPIENWKRLVKEHLWKNHNLVVDRVEKRNGNNIYVWLNKKMIPYEAFTGPWRRK